MRYGVEVFHALKAVLKAKGMNTAVGDEGGFAPDLGSNEEALQTIAEAVEKAGYTLGRDIYLGPRRRELGVLRERRYTSRVRGSQVHVDRVRGASSTISSRAIRSCRSKTAWPRTTGTAGRRSSKRLRDKVQLVGDDLFVTNTAILQQGIERKIANSILIKPNQIGTLTETLEAIEMATKAGYSAVVSHRSGETEDATIADIAVATGATQIKTGSLCRSDRLAKYNQLLRIERSLGAKREVRWREGVSRVAVDAR